MLLPMAFADTLRALNTMERHSSLALPEKVRLVMELQRIALPLIARRRPLRSWERA